MKNWQNMPHGIRISRRSVNKKYSKVLSIPGIWQDAGVMLVGTPQHIALTLIVICKILGVSADYILFGEMKEENITISKEQFEAINGLISMFGKEKL